MNRDNNHKALDTLLAESMDSEVPAEVETRLRRRLDDFRMKMASTEPAAASRAWSISISHNWRRALAVALPAAAAILLAAVIWSTFGGGNGSRAYAQVVEQLRQARTLSYKVRIAPVPLMQEFTCEVEYMEPGRCRQQVAGDVVSIFDWRRNQGVTLLNSQKAYILIDLSAAPAETSQIDLIEELRALPERATARLGTREEDGRALAGFQVVEVGLEKNVWVDASTGDLVRIDGRFVNAPETTVVMSDFRFDVDLDESRFSVEPPADYRALTEPISVETPTEDDLLYLLRYWAEHHKKRRFPQALDPIGFGKAVMEMTEAGDLADFNAGDADEGKLIQETVRMTRGLMFVMQMKPENEWHYAGEGVTLGDAAIPIAWWKPEGSETYRVVYGDLAIDDVPLEELAPAAETP